MRSHIAPTVRLALPIAAGNLSDMLTVVADTVMIGWLGTVPLAAATLSNTVYMIGFLLVLGFSVALTPIAGEAFGRRNVNDLAVTIRSGAAVTLVIAFVVCLLMLVAYPLLHLTGSPSDVIEQGWLYFLWLLPALMFRTGYGVLRHVSEAMNNTRMPMIVAIASNILNVVLNYILIFGALGIPALGLEGAGIATLISRIAGVALIWWIYRHSRFFAVLRAVVSGIPDGGAKATLSFRTASWSILRTGWPIAGQMLMEVAGFAAGAFIVAGFGAVPLAAHQIALNLVAITFMMALGISAAATVRVSNAIGSRSFRNARQAAKAAFVLVLLWNAATAVTLMLLRFQLPSMYTADAEVVSLAAQLLIFGAMFQIFDGSQNVGLGILRGYSDVKIPTVLAAIAYTVFCIPVSYTLAHSFDMGPVGVWIGYLVGLAFASVAFYLRFLKVSAAASCNP